MIARMLVPRSTIETPKIPCRLAVLALFLAPAPEASAQDVHLLRLPGEAVEVMYSPGSLDRAAHVQKRLQVLAGTLRDWTEQPVGMTAYVLSRDDWTAAKAGPYYGIPGRVTGDALAVAAEGDLRLAGFWQYLLGRPAPQLPGTPLVGPPEGADALAVSDLMLQLEATDSMLRQAGRSANSPLTMRLAVHLTAWDILAMHEPQRMADVRSVFADLGRWPTQAVGSGSLTIEQWLSLESHFFEGADIIRQAVGKNPSKKVLRAARETGLIDLESLTEKKKVRGRLEAWSEDWAEAALSEIAGDGIAAGD